MTKKYRETVNKPLKYIGTKIKKISDIDAPTKSKKVLKGSALVGMTLVGFMVWFAKFVALDNKLMRKLEKKLSEIKVGKDKNGYEKKFQAFIKKNPNLSAVAIWWAMLAMLIGGGSYLIKDKDFDNESGQIKKEIKKTDAGKDSKTVSFDIVQKQQDIKKKLGTPVKMTDKATIKRAVKENFAYTQAVLFSTENYRTDWFCDYITGNKNTLGVGMYYVPDAAHPYDFKCASWDKASKMFNAYPKMRGQSEPRELKDNEVYDAIEGWFFYMDNGYNFNHYMCNILAGSNVSLTPRDMTVISSVLFNSPQCCEKFCKYIVAHPNNRMAWARYLLQVDDDVDVQRLKNFPGLKSRRVHEILLLLDIDNYCQDMFGVQIDCKRSSAVSYANNYFDKLRGNFSKETLLKAKSVICHGVVGNGVSVCQVVQKSDKYRDIVFSYCADVDGFLYSNERQKVYDQALACYNAKDYNGALRGFNKVIELEGVSPELYNDLAITYIHYGNYDKSIEMSKKSLEIGSGDAVSASYFNLGLAYEKKGELKTAKKYYALSAKEENSVAKSKLQKFQEDDAKRFSEGTAKVQQNQLQTSKFVKSLFGNRKD